MMMPILNHYYMLRIPRFL